MNQPKLYLPGLNGIRAIAALIVIVFHIDNYLPMFNLPQIGFSTHQMASYAVVIFFALSGYLITYLLLAEKKRFQQIDLAKFYMRRILRIWPVYYVVILMGIIFFLAYPSSNEHQVS